MSHGICHLINTWRNWKQVSSILNICYKRECWKFIVGVIGQFGLRSFYLRTFTLKYIFAYKKCKFTLNSMQVCLLLKNKSIIIVAWHFRVQKLIRDNKVMIFSATYCSYCNVAKRTFDSLGTNYSAIELNKVQDGQELAKDLKEIVGNGYVSCTTMDLLKLFQNLEKLSLKQLILLWFFPNEP